MFRSLWRRKLLLPMLIVALAAAAGCSSAANDAGSAAPSMSSPPASSAPSPSVTSPAPEPVHSTTTPAGDGAALGRVTALRLATPQIGWAGGEGWIARTEDGGRSWSSPYRHDGITLQVFALDANRVWATLDTGDGSGAKLIRSVDGGTSWSPAGTVPNRGFLHFASDTEGFSGNAMTTDGGKTWRTLGTAGESVGDAYYHDRDNGWAVQNGKTSFQIRRTTDGGKSWKTVLTRDSDVPPTDAVIRSTGKNDAWVLLVGDSGMTQTSYSLFHTADGGKRWQPVLANSGAGSGPAPGFGMDETGVPRSAGNSPGALYVVNPQTAFMGAQCQACDNPNTIGLATDGGRTWTNLPGAYPGYGPQQLAAADASQAWWVLTDNREPSRMYVTSDGGKHWKLVHTFEKPTS